MLVKRILRAVLLLLFALYIGLFLFAVFLSDSMIFLPHPASYRDTPEVLKIGTANGNKISAVYLPNPAAKFTLLVSHGNAEDLGDDRYWLEELRRAGFSVFAYDYEGYGTSEGKASEKTVYQDEAAAYDYRRLTWERRPIALSSSGARSAPAQQLTSQREDRRLD
jgi:pimeloyl-ACP methyl ester carboxylesterase